MWCPSNSGIWCPQNQPCIWATENVLDKPEVPHSSFLVGSSLNVLNNFVLSTQQRIILNSLAKSSSFWKLLPFLRWAVWGPSGGMTHQGAVLALWANSGPDTSRPSWPEEGTPLLSWNLCRVISWTSSDGTQHSGASATFSFRRMLLPQACLSHLPTEPRAQDTMASSPSHVCSVHPGVV